MNLPLQMPLAILAIDGELGEDCTDGLIVPKVLLTKANSKNRAPSPNQQKEPFARLTALFAVKGI
jgi:hypothetical protein